VTKESASDQDFTRAQGNSSHWEQASSRFFPAQQLRVPQAGCFSKKPGPAQPGHLELPAVWNLGHSPQSMPQQPSVGAAFEGRFTRGVGFGVVMGRA
jgi:hypothetical protein